MVIFLNQNIDLYILKSIENYLENRFSVILEQATTEVQISLILKHYIMKNKMLSYRIFEILDFNVFI